MVKFLGKDFGTEREVMQADPASTIIFNIVVYMVVREELDVVCGPKEAQHGLVWEAGGRNLVLYANNGRISGWYHKLVQNALTVRVAMFLRMGLDTNLDKTKYVVCTPSFISLKWSYKAYKQRLTGEGEVFRERNRMQVSCTKCGMPLESSYLKHHMEHLHGICVTYTIGFL